jgi:SAM-dependent methyltransferase
MPLPTPPLPNPTDRFTDRVESYRLHRPGYPHAIVDLLARECGLTGASTIADIAAGTGLLSEIFLEHGYSVNAVEPNAPMRAVCESLQPRFPHLHCFDGTAEATGLPDQSTDLITAAQAMHWFDLPRTRAEFARILRPHGWRAVIYNERRIGGDAFHEGYEQILRNYGTDYLQVQRQHLSAESIDAFFLPREAHHALFPNEQHLTLEALEGRIRSSSYMPQPGDPGFEEMRIAIEKLHTKHQSNNTVTLRYDCTITYGHLSTQ